ncbi:MAG: hypothetical protein CMG07_00130 [Candidatus Marinimicrobia bacterium]|nr:hypothetical protein [Candidatus Neomarinimicrobiota bacterium]|tara:strand:+ start:506 stop:1087 length:582 start_codon:yes stop_codon:yes gene_type:complete
MKNERKIEERKIRKERIIIGAINIFKKKGVENATMSEIAKESGFGTATLYYYFPSKEEILINMMERGWMQLWESIEDKMNENIPSRQKFIKLLNIMSKTVKNNKTLYEFLFTAPNIIDKSKQSWKPYQESLYKSLQEILEEGAKDDNITNLQPELVMKALGGIFHGIVFLGYELNENEFTTIMNKFLKPSVKK